MKSVFGILLVCIPLTATATTYYVDQNHASASDTNPGTVALPWKTFKKATNTATAGDTVIVKAGRYTDPDGDWINAFNPTNTGTSSAPMTFRSEPRHAAVLVSNGDGMAAMTLHGNKHYITVDGFSIEGRIGLISPNTSYCTIQNCDLIYGNWIGSDTSLNWGIEVSGVTYCTIRNNRVHNVRSSGNNSHNTACIMLYGGYTYPCRYNLIEHNDVNAGGGIMFCGYGQKGGNTHNNTWRWNIARSATAAFFGIGATAGDITSTYNTYYENIAINCGIAFYFDHHTGNFSAYNNTLYNCGNCVYAYKDTNQSHSVWNNIGIATGDVYNSENSAMNLLFTKSDFNCVSGRRMGNYHYDQIVWVTLAGWQSYWQATTAFDAHSISTNPLFVSASSENFHLQTGSPCRAVGEGGVDMGAYPRGDDGTIIGLTDGEYPDTTPPHVTITVAPSAIQ